MATSGGVPGRSGEAVEELGTVICRHCNTMIATLPTESVKFLYGVCTEAKCISERHSREPQLD